MERDEAIESPRKRLKTDDASAPDTIAAPAASQGAERPDLPVNPLTGLKEAEVGILEFVSTDVSGFEGILKKRYTDFLVNEILPSGEVLHLRNSQPPVALKSSAKKESESKPTQPVEVKTDADNASGAAGGENPVDAASEQKAAPETSLFAVSEEDRALLESFFGPDVAEQLIQFHDRVRSSPKSRPAELGRLSTGIITDRDLRTKIHQAIRRIFNSILESSTQNDGSMNIAVAPNRHNKSSKGFRGATGGPQRDRSTWEELGGPYLHFTIYKENKDTMETVSFIARQLKMNARSFQFAGTKDRRGVTVQRACVLKVYADRLAQLNKTLRNARLGDFEYQQHGLELGDLEGNEFVITLRDCKFPGTDSGDSAIARAKELVGKALHDLRERGYLNYYGLQRFGTFTTGTHIVGIKMLQGDFKGAVDAILRFAPEALSPADHTGLLIGSDDRARAEAINIFQTTRKVTAALDKLPRKFSAETNLIRSLGRSGTDFLGALQTIPRNLRLMYVHAYQSLVWNHAASERWRLYGDRVVEGDLVIVNQQDKNDAEEVDADGEVIVVPQTEDSATAIEDMFTRARPLSADEAASGKYSMFDVVLPLPGFDVVYPENEMTAFYQRFMGSEKGGGLDPFNMRKKWKDVSLSGSYRKLLSRPGASYSFEIKSYSQDDEQFVQTDLDRLDGKLPEQASNSASSDENKIAAILKFQLGSSQYATMALRELMKSGGVKEHKPEYGGR